MDLRSDPQNSMNALNDADGIDLNGKIYLSTSKSANACDSAPLENGTLVMVPITRSLALLLADSLTYSALLASLARFDALVLLGPSFAPDLFNVYIRFSESSFNHRSIPP